MKQDGDSIRIKKQEYQIEIGGKSKKSDHYDSIIDLWGIIGRVRMNGLLRLI